MYLYTRTRTVRLEAAIRNKQNVKIWTLKVKFQGILTRTVKKMKITICSQWPTIYICGYPSQQLEDCARIRTANLQDVILNMTRTVNLMCNLNLKELYYHCHMHTAMKTIDMQTVPELFNIRYDCQ